MDNLIESAIIIAPNTLPQSYRLEQFEALVAQCSEQETLRQALDLDIDIEHIRRRYDAEKSFFSKLADQYVSLHWWMKLALGLLVIGIASMLHMSILVSIVCYIGLSLLFFEHTQRSDAYQARVFKEVRQLKMELASTIQHTDAIKVSILQIMHNLNNLNIELTQSYAIHQAQIQELNFQIENSQAIIRTLTETTQNLRVSLSTHQEELDRAYQLVRQHEQTLDQQARALENINTILSTEIAAIRAKKIELDEKCSELSHILTGFSPEPQQVEEDATLKRAQVALNSSEEINIAVQQLIQGATLNNSFYL